MPTEYGGLAGSTTDLINDIYREIQANETFFIEEETTKRVNEQSQSGKSKSESDHFGQIFNLFSSSKSKQWLKHVFVWIPEIKFEDARNFGEERFCTMNDCS